MGFTLADTGHPSWDRSPLLLVLGANREMVGHLRKLLEVLKQHGHLAERQRVKRCIAQLPPLWDQLEALWREEGNASVDRTANEVDISEASGISATTIPAESNSKTDQASGISEDADGTGAKTDIILSASEGNDEEKKDEEKKDEEKKDEEKKKKKKNSKTCSSERPPLPQ